MHSKERGEANKVKDRYSWNGPSSDNRKLKTTLKYVEISANDTSKYFSFAKFKCIINFSIEITYHVQFRRFLKVKLVISFPCFFQYLKISNSQDAWTFSAYLHFRTLYLDLAPSGSSSCAAFQKNIAGLQNADSRSQPSTSIHAFPTFGHYEQDTRSEEKCRLRSN